MKHIIIPSVASLVIAVVTLLGMIFVPSVEAIGSMSVTGGSVQINKNITVKVRGTATGVYGAAVTLAYNPADLQFVSATGSGSLTTQTAYGVSGSVVRGDAFSTGPVSGTFDVASITFKAKKGSGSTTLSLSQSGDFASHLYNSDGQVVGGTSVGSSTISFTSPAPAPAPTPTPTPTPSTPAPTTPTPSTPTPSTSTPKPSTSTPSTPSKPTPTTPDEPGQSVEEIESTGIIKKIKFGIFDRNQKPLVKKEVTLHSDPQTATTDEEGYVTFENVPVGTHSIEYNDGKTTHAKTVVLASATAQSVVYDFEQPSGPPTWLIVLLGGTLLLLGAAGGFFVLKKRQAQASVFTATAIPTPNYEAPTTPAAGITPGFDPFSPDNLKGQDPRVDLTEIKKPELPEDTTNSEEIK